MIQRWYSIPKYKITTAKALIMHTAYVPKLRYLPKKKGHTVSSDIRHIIPLS